MSSYAGQTALTALWNKVVAVLAGKADRASVYSKAEVDYKLATTYGLSGGDSGDYVTLSGTETIDGVKTFTGTGNVFYSQGLKIRSSANTSNYATLYNTASSATSVYMPTNSGANYLLGRSAATTTANTVPYYSNATGGMSTKTLQTGTTLTNSTSYIPTSYAIIQYLLSKGVISSA